MPLYEYQCPRCGRFEVIRRFADAALTICPTCGAEVQKLFSAPAIQFKGTGWYVTDYARKSGGGDVKSGETKSSEPASPSTAKDAPSAASASTPSKDGSGSGSTPASK